MLAFLLSPLFEKLVYEPDGFYPGDDFHQARARGPPHVPPFGTFRYIDGNNRCITFRGDITSEHLLGFKCESMSHGCFLYYSNEKFDDVNMARSYLCLCANDYKRQEKLFGLPLTKAAEKDIFTSKYIFIVNLGFH